ncbi:MAG: endonuclease/exonuclease/phosphatase family protein [Burkholderiales bacterium]|nr:endonuclease/exonuclease/phosphatase family protein [Burkholderiales bacterium]
MVTAGADLRVATWNLHSGVGRDGRYDGARVIAVLAEIDADIVALQEVPSLALHAELMRGIQTSLGVRIAMGRTLTRGDADFGNALLSRFPIAGQDNVDLTVAAHEPRNAIDAVVDVAGHAVRVLATHLGLRPAERRIQVQRILSTVGAASEVPTLLLGDINEWYLWGRPLRWLRARFRAAPAPATFPSRLPLLALDRIWVHPPGALHDVRVHRTPLARAASDHLPLIGRFAFPAKPCADT